MTLNPEGEQLASPRAGLVLAAAMAGVVLVSLDVSVVNVAIHALQRSLHARIDDLQWIVSLYTLTYAVFLLSAGGLSDRFGPRAVFLAGLAFFTTASLMCGIAPSLFVLLLARAAQGVGAAFLVPSSMAILQLAYPDSARRASAVGLWAGAGSLALAAGPLLGGALIDTLGWRTIFLINVPIGLVGGWLAQRHAPRVEAKTMRALDVPGQIIAALMLICLVFTLIEAGAARLDLAEAILGLVLSGMMLIALLRVESKAAEPMMPLAMFGSRIFSVTTFVGMVLNFVFYGLIFVFSLFFQTVQHRSAFATGLAFLPMTALIMLVNILAGRMIGRFGVRPVLLVGLLVAAVGYGAMLIIKAETSYALIIPSFAVAGVGVALTVPAIVTAALDNAHAGRTGIASGVLNASRQVGGAIGVAAFGAIVGAAGPAGFVGAMHLSIGMAAAALAASFFASLLLIPSALPDRV